jgi:hypothetical protein
MKIMNFKCIQLHYVNFNANQLHQYLNKLYSVQWSTSSASYFLIDVGWFSVYNNE